MDVEKLRWLTPRSLGSDPAGDWTDIAMHLARCSNEASDYGRAKYSLQWDREIHVARNLAASVKKPDKLDDESFVRLVYMIVYESLGSGKCRVCKGRGQVVNKKVESCTGCGGTGGTGRRELKHTRTNYWGATDWMRYDVLIDEMLEVVNGWERELMVA